MESYFSKKDTNIVKGVAIIIMMLHHCFLSANRFDKFAVDFFPLSQNLVIAMARAGKCCVGIFTFLSAYGLTRSYMKQEKEYGSLGESKMAEKFVLRRCINLLSGFWFVYLVAFIGSCFLSKMTPLAIYCGDEADAFRFLYYMLLDMLGLSRLFGTPALINTWWYMGLALTVIFIFPIMIKVYRHYGGIVIPAMFCLFCAFQLEKTDFSRWLFLVPIGILFADRRILEKCKEWKLHQNHLFSQIFKFGLLSACLVLSAVFWAKNYYTKDYSTFFIDTMLTICVVLWVYLFTADIPVLSNILGFLGKHSMNIFLIHSFLRVRWCPEHIYSFKNFLLIILVLLAESTALSILIEILKNHCGYLRLVQKLKTLVEK